MLKIQISKLLGRSAGLGMNELKFVAGSKNNFGTRLGAHTNPIEASGCRLCAIGFYRNFKSFGVKSIDKGLIEL